jgi:hypothetical protein
MERDGSVSDHTMISQHPKKCRFGRMHHAKQLPVYPPTVVADGCLKISYNGVFLLKSAHYRAIAEDFFSTPIAKGYKRSIFLRLWIVADFL